MSVVKFVKSARLSFRDLFILPALIMMLIAGANSTRQWLRDLQSPSDYFVVNQISIPSHKYRENPRITYDRVVYRDYTATFVAEIQEATSLQSVCSSTKTVLYSPKKDLPAGGPTLSWLMYREPLPDCLPPPGRYRVNICWTIQRDRASDARVCANSNVFEVKS